MLSTNIWTLIFTVINLIILFILMKVFLFGRVNKILDKRAEIIRRQFEDADVAQREAEDLRVEYEKSLASAKEESAQIVDEARAKAKDEYDRILDDAGKEAEQMKEKAMSDIEAEREKSLNSLKNEIAGLVVSATAKVVGRESLDVDNSKLYDDFIAEMGEKIDE